MATIIREYRDVSPEEMSKRTVLDVIANSPRVHNKPVELIHATAGFECAGSMARYTSEKWGIIHQFDGASHGKWFTLQENAQKEFARHRITQKEYEDEQNAAWQKICDSIPMRQVNQKLDEVSREKA